MTVPNTNDTTTNTPANDAASQQQQHPENFNESSGNENIDRLIDESIRAQDEGKTSKQTDASSQGSSDGTQTDTANQQGGATTQSAQGGSGANAAAQPQQQQQHARHPNLPEGLSEDGKGNIVDKAGKIVVNAGNERRQWERAENAIKSNTHAQAYIKRLETELTAAQTTRDTANYLNGVPAQLNLQPQEVATGLNIVAAWKKNPHEAIKFLLTEYAALGHNVNELLGKEGGIDLNAVQTMINRAVAPMVTNHAQQQGQTEALARAEREYNSFMAKYPEAIVHENEIAALMAKDKSLSADTAFFRLKTWVLENGYDFSKPLGPQLQAAPQGAQGHNQPPVQGSNQRMNGAPPLPNGRGTSEAALNTHQGAARADDDWDSIIRGEMKRSGFNA